MDEARARLLEMVGVLPAMPVPLARAAGLVLAADVVARRNLPGFDNSAMDGFAVRAADTAGAGPERPARLRLTGEVAAGAVFDGSVEAGTAVRIMTGAPIPPGADAVIEVEQADVEDGVVLARLDVQPGRSLRRAGEDIRRGEVALGGGAWLGPAQLALLAALGETTPACVPRPRVAVIPTGDELLDPATEPGPGQVTDVVSTGITAAVVAAGGEPVLVATARDTEADVRRALADAAEADLIVTVGGVSMGAYDFVRRVIEDEGDLDFWRVAMRPGKPLAVGRVGGKPVVGLPGNPVSALVGFEVYVLPAIQGLAGRQGWARPRRRCTLTRDIAAAPGLRVFARAEVRRQAGVLEATPVEGQGSHQLRSLAAANALLDIPADAGDLLAGAEVEAILLNHPPGPGWA